MSLFGRGTRSGSQSPSGSEADGEGGSRARRTFRGAVGNLMGRLSSRSPSPGVNKEACLEGGEAGNEGTDVGSTQEGAANAGGMNFMKSISSTLSLSTKLTKWRNRARAGSKGGAVRDNGSDAESDRDASSSAIGATAGDAAVPEKLEEMGDVGHSTSDDRVSAHTSGAGGVDAGAGTDVNSSVPESRRARMPTLDAVQEEVGGNSTNDERAPSTPPRTTAVDADIGITSQPSFYRRFTSSVRQTFQEAFRPHQLAGADWDEEVP